MKKCPSCETEKPYSEYPRHKNRKNGVSAYCKICQRLKMIEYRSTEDYKEKKRIYEREYLKRPSVKIHRQDYALRYYYNITLAEKKMLWKRQGFQCGICKKDIPNFKDVRLDHDHKDKKVRGILCNDCNLLIGHAKDDVKILKSAVNYLTS